MFDLRSPFRLTLLAALFVPSVLALIREGMALPLFGVLILGTLTGYQLRPFVRQPGGAVAITLGTMLV